MHKKIASLAAALALFVGVAHADINVPLSGPATVLAATIHNYSMTFTLVGQKWVEGQTASIRNPAGIWSTSTAALSVSHNGQNHVQTISKQVPFFSAGSWEVRLRAPTRQQPPCHHNPCPGPGSGTPRSGSKGVAAV